MHYFTLLALSFEKSIVLQVRLRQIFQRPPVGAVGTNVLSGSDGDMHGNKTLDTGQIRHAAENGSESGHVIESIIETKHNASRRDGTKAVPRGPRRDQIRRVDIVLLCPFLARNTFPTGTKLITTTKAIKIRTVKLDVIIWKMLIPLSPRSFLTS